MFGRGGGILSQSYIKYLFLFDYTLRFCMSKESLCLS